MLRRLFYYGCRLVSCLAYWSRRRFTPAGLSVAGGLVFSAIVGVDTTRTATYQIFTFLFALLLVAIACSFFLRPSFTARRILPRFGSVGETLAYHLAIQNRTLRRQGGVTLWENLADPRPTFQEFAGGQPPAGKNRLWSNWNFGPGRWQRLVSQKQAGIAREQPLPFFQPGETSEAPMEIMPMKRGHLRFKSVTLARTDPFGLFRAFRTVPLEQSVLILPKRYSLPAIEMPGAMKYQQGGVALASSVGQSEEFVSLRDYRPGDPFRHVHWKSWARTGKPVVKEFEDEFFVRHALILDTFLETEDTALFEEAVSVAASFVCTVRTQESLLDLLFVGPEAYCFTAGRGVGHTDRMLEILASVSPCQDKPFDALQHLVIRHCSSVSGCICVFLTWDEERRALVERLKFLGIPMRIFVVTNDLSGPLDPGPLKDQPKVFHHLRVGRVQEGLAKL